MIKKDKVIVALCVGMMTLLCYGSSMGMEFKPSIRNMLLALCIVAGIKYKKSFLMLKEIFGIYKTCLLIIIANLLAVWFLTGIFYIEDAYDCGYNKYYFFFISVVWIHFIVVYVLSLFANGMKICKKDFKLEKSTIKRDVLWICLFLLLNFLCIIAFNPAITSRDSEDCYYYSKVLGLSPVPSGHPIFYMVFLKFILNIYDSLTLVILVQIIFFVFIFLRGIHMLEDFGIKKFWLMLILYGVGMGISSIIQINTVWKDIPYCISLLWFSITLIRLIINENNTISLLWSVEFIVSGILTGMFRYNGAIVVCVSGLILSIFYRRKLLVVLSIAISCSFIIAIIPGVLGIYEKIEEPGIKYYALANDIGYVYYNGGNVSYKAQKIVEDLKSGSNYEFDAYYTKMGRENFDDYSVDDFLLTYIETLKNNTCIMTEGFLKRTTAIWSITLPKDEHKSCVNYLGEAHFLKYEGHYPHRNDNHITYLMTKLFNKFTDSSIMYIFYWRTGIYTLSVLFILLLLSFLYGKASFKLMLPFFPMLLNLLSYAIASGWPDYRYYWPVMILSAFLIPYGMVMISKARNK